MNISPDRAADFIAAEPAPEDDELEAEVARPHLTHLSILYNPFHRTLMMQHIRTGSNLINKLCMKNIQLQHLRFMFWLALCASPDPAGVPFIGVDSMPRAFFTVSLDFDILPMLKFFL